MSHTKRKTLFDRYAANLSLVKKSHGHLANKELPPGFDNAVFCPLCLRMFSERALFQTESIPLTLEDVPPKSFGGKPKVLTCKECNNTSGTKLDSQLLEYFIQRNFMTMKLNSSMKFKNMSLRKPGHSLKASGTITHFKEKGLAFKYNIQKNDPRYKKFIALMNAPGELEAGFDAKEPSALAVETALLRIAYLICYEKFGNTFILNQTYNAIRKQILHPDEETLPFRGMCDPEKNTFPEGIFIINEPSNLKGFLVVFPLKTDHDTILM